MPSSAAVDQTLPTRAQSACLQTTRQGRNPGPRAPLILDISRLIWRGLRRAPTGIDRVELAYSQQYIANDQPRRPVFAVLHLFGFLFVIRHRGAQRFIADLTARWNAGAGEGARTGGLPLPLIYARLLVSLLLGGYPLALRRLWRPRRAIFVVVSHHHVASQPAIRRLCRSYGLRTVCFVHDLLAIEYPEYFPGWWQGWFKRIAWNSRNSFAAIIVNSRCTARSLEAHRRRSAAIHCPPIWVAPLGTRQFPMPAVRPSAAQAYFVVLGTIEPRKNHLLLLNLWTRFAERLEHPPRLLVVGARGWENEQVVDMLERSVRLRPYVTECNGLGDHAVGELLAGARALLIPSLAEGFGMPLTEALAAGVPVLCSDIAVFREIGENVPEYLDPLEIGAWYESVLAYARPGSTRRQEQLNRLRGWRAPDWQEHFEIVEQVLESLDDPDGVTAMAAEQAARP